MILRPASKDWLRRLLKPIVRDEFWFTRRFPFCQAVITHPDFVTNPKDHPVLQHELHHVEQFSKWWAPFVLPLLATCLPSPVFFSGRWYVERWAYLADIRAGRLTIDGAVQALWSGYGWCWPKPLMRKWFKSKLPEHISALV